MTKSIKTLAALTLAGTALLGSGLAQAHTDVSVSIGLPLPRIVLPLPVVVAPAPAPVTPVYVRPAPVYYPGYYVAAPRRDRDHDGIPDRWDRHDNRWETRYDQRMNERYHDRDRDGLPDRYDQHPGRPSRH